MSDATLAASPRSALSHPRLAKPDLARLILVGTVGIIGLALAIFLLLMVYRERTTPVVAGWIPLSSGSGTITIPFQEEDLIRLGSGYSGKTPRQTDVASILSQLEECHKANLSRPLVLYLSAPGISDSTYKETAQQSEDTTKRGSDWNTRLGGKDQDLISFERFEPILKALDSGRVPRLLILDVGQVGSDWRLGVFGNGFVAKLKGYFEDPATTPRNLMVLVSCAPGQVSWSSEREHRSVFAYFVERVLSGELREDRPLRASELHRLVAGHVERWVSSNRPSSRQTPMLLGDLSHDFLIKPKILPREIAAKSPPSEAKKTGAGKAAEGNEIDKDILTKLERAWTERDELEAKAKPYRREPTLWRQYFEELLSAEQSFRLGRYEESRESLRTLSKLKSDLVDGAYGCKIKRPWSLAAAEAQLAANPDDKALRELVNRSKKAMAKYAEDLTGKLSAPDAAAPKPTATPEGDGKARAATNDKGGGAAVAFDPAAVVKFPSELLSEIPPVPLFIEAQLLSWADVYNGLKGKLEFKDARGANFRKALKLRALAETAAESDERFRRWVAPFVVAGDTHRRLFQDSLFGVDLERAEDFKSAHDLAETQYNQAISVAKTLGDATDLLNRLAVELPYLADWQGARGSQDEGFALILQTATNLAANLDGFSDKGDSLDSTDQILKALLAIRPKTETLKDRYDRFMQRFGQVVEESKGREVSNWRVVDAILRVPTIASKDRMALLQKVRSKTLTAALDEENGTIGETIPDSPDPEFGPRALLLAQVELCLDAIGGLPSTEHKRFNDDVESLEGKPVDAKFYDTMTRFSSQTRAARIVAREALRDLKPLKPPTNTIERVKPEVEQAEAEATFGAKARRSCILPSSTIPGLAKGDAERILAYHLRKAQLLWHASRLETDFAPEHAQMLHQAARLVAEEGGIASPPEAGPDSIGNGPRLVLSTQPSGGLTVEDEPKPIIVSVSGSAEIPAGDSALLLGGDPSKLRIVSQAKAEAADAPLLPIGSKKDTQTFRLSRANYESRESEVSLRPILFYRGHSYPSDNALNVTLARPKDRVVVKIKEKDPKGWTDQFKDHPDEGYLHYLTRLDYKLVFENTTDKPLEVIVERQMDSNEKMKPVTLKLQPKVPIDISDYIQAIDQPEFKGDVKLPLDSNSVNRRTKRELRVSVFENNRERTPCTAPRKFTFRQEEIDEYVAVVPEFNSQVNRFNLYLVRKSSDKDNRPLRNVTAYVGDRSVPMVGDLGKSQCYWFYFDFIGPPPEQSYHLNVDRAPNVFAGKLAVKQPAKAEGDGAPKQ